MPLSPSDIQAIVDALKESILQDDQFASRMQGPTGPPGLKGPPGSDGIKHDNVQLIDTKWRIEEFGLFEPDLAVDNCHPEGDVITVGRDIIYRNVDAFCQRIQDAIATKGPQIVCDNLQLCLRGHVQGRAPQIQTNARITKHAIDCISNKIRTRSI